MTIDLAAGLIPSLTVLYGEAPGDAAGRVSAVGDINGDGFEDVVIGAPSADGYAPTRVDAGRIYVVFGSAAGLPSTVDLSDVGNGIGGIRIQGEDAQDKAGLSVSSAGDFNGDGYDDLLIATTLADGPGNGQASAGATYVVFGQGGPWLAPISLADVAAGIGGFVIHGEAAGDQAGSAAAAGDVNGDGYDDLVIGASTAEGPSLPNDSGEAYVVYGHGGPPAAVSLSTIAAGSGGLVLHGIDLGDQAGVSVASAGDVNGDGFDDIILGAFGGDGPGNGRSTAGDSYVVFGQAGGLVSPINLSAVASGIGGFVIYGDETNDISAFSVSSAGDINGDGFDDLLIGAQDAQGPGNTRYDGGSTYVVFGQAGPFAPSVDLNAITNGNGSAGFVIHGEQSLDGSGRAVSAAGDINGDGYDDLLIGAWQADGPSNSRSIAGAGYVVFGQGGSFLPSLDLLAVAAGVGGILLHGASAGDLLGTALARAGDVDGDGLDDVMFGAYGGDGPPGIPRIGAGEAYLLFGSYTTNTADDHVTQMGTGSGELLIGTTGDDDMVGGRGDDVLVAGGGNDVLRGGQGDDTLIIGNPNTMIGFTDPGFQRVSGGTGRDTLIVNFASSSNFPLADTDFRRIDGIEALRLGNLRHYIELGPIAERAFDWLPTDPYKIVIDGLLVTGFWVEIDGSALTQSMKVDLSNNAGQVWLTGGAGDDWLHGGFANDVLLGGGGNDTLIAGQGGGDDHYDGGVGNDTILFSSAINPVVVDLAAPNDQAVGTDIGTDQIANVENVVGGSGDDTIVGDAAANRLDGGAGDDGLTGGEGDDTFRLRWAGGGAKEADVVTDFGNGADRIDVSAVEGLLSFDDLAVLDGPTGDAVVGFDGHRVLLLGVDAASLDADDFVFAPHPAPVAVNDRWTMSHGATAMVSPMALLANDSGVGPLSLLDVGDAANGTLSTGAAGPAFTATANPAASRARFRYTMGDEVDSDTALVEVALVETSSRGDRLTVATLQDEASFVDGLGGSDVLTGGQGRDTLRGDGGRDSMFGLAGRDLLFGGLDDDRLDGGAGSDFMAGGAGNDLYWVDATDDLVQELAGEGGADRVHATASFTLPTNVENLTLLGSEAIDGAGNGSANRIEGNAAANALLGGAGRDQLVGGGGIDNLDGGEDGDTYTIDRDIIRDTGTTGTDTAITNRSTTLASDSGIEILKGKVGSTGSFVLTGNELDNRLIGNDGDNLLRGLAGADGLYGGLGKDRLEGGRGRDGLFGEDDADTFVFKAGDSDATATGFDVVYDFLTGIDRVDLDAIGAQGLPVAAYAERSVASDTFGAAKAAAAEAMAGGAVAVAFVAGTSNGWLFWSTDGNPSTIEQAIRLNGANTLGAFASTDLI